MKNYGGIAFAVMAGAVCAAQIAVAGESGSFELLESYVHDYTVMEHAGTTITNGPLRGTATIVRSGTGPFAQGSRYGAACLVYAKESAVGIDLDVPCAFTDSSGDKWYMLVKESDSAIGDGKGNQRIVGGTGKYAGVTGNCPYELGNLPDKWLVAASTCTWRKP